VVAYLPKKTKTPLTDRRTHAHEHHQKMTESPIQARMQLGIVEREPGLSASVPVAGDGENLDRLTRTLFGTVQWHGHVLQHETSWTLPS
jgi:hypothetical protein